MIVNPADPFSLIGYAMLTAPGSVAPIPLYDPATPANDLIVQAKLRHQPIPAAVRAQMAQDSPNGDRPPTHIQVGRALVILPSDVVRNIRGDQASRDPMFVFVVRREVYDIGPCVRPSQGSYCRTTFHG